MKPVFFRSPSLGYPLFAGLLGIVLNLSSICAQAPSVAAGKAQDFKVPEIDSTTKQIKSLLTGKSAESISPGKFLLTGMRVEVYSYPEGIQTIDLIVEAPACHFDYKTRIADSDGFLTLQSGDGNLKVTGKGFRWNPTEFQLFISNQVHTLLKSPTPEPITSPENPAEP